MAFALVTMLVANVVNLPVFAVVTPIGTPSIDAVPLPVITGFEIVGAVPNTKAPVPVSSVTAASKLADDGVAKNVATFVPSPLTPVLIGSPVQLVKVPDAGVPNVGVTKVGLVANTKAPDPVSSVTAVFKFALEGVDKKVATPVPNPEIPVAIGNPVQLVNVPDVGVPNTGVDNVGLTIVLLIKKLSTVICFVTLL